MRENQSVARKARFMRFMLSKIEDVARFESPMALYEWFVRSWDRPLRPDALQEAYLAAWAVSIDRGLVKL